jgi:GABA(A) receptor-associated protein
MYKFCEDVFESSASAVKAVDWKAAIDAAGKATVRGVNASKAVLVANGPEGLSNFLCEKKTYPTFSEMTTLQYRQSVYSSLKESHPDKIPVIVERARKSILTDFKPRKMLVPENMSTSLFIFQLKKSLLYPQQSSSSDKASSTPLAAIFITSPGPYGNGCAMMVACARTMRDFYNVNKNHHDGFLYLTCQEENVFGGG